MSGLGVHPPESREHEATRVRGCVGASRLRDRDVFGVEDELRGLGVRYPAIPTKGKPGAARRQVEQRRAFRKLVRWRTGSEGRINCAKRDFGLARTRYIGIDGARTWCGHGVFNHNLVKIAALTDTN